MLQPIFMVDDSRWDAVLAYPAGMSGPYFDADQLCRGRIDATSTFNQSTSCRTPQKTGQCSADVNVKEKARMISEVKNLM
jgi:hypothetical protein